jgi:hypothetical protein
MLDEITRALTPVAVAFDALSIPYFIGGSVALHAHSAYRMTNDIDLVADVHTEHADLLEMHLKAEYYADAYMIRQAVLRASSFNVIHFETAIKVDVFILKKLPYTQEQMRRRISETLLPGGRTFSFVSAEDMVLSKLDWYRIGGEMSARQWNDIKGVLRNKDDDLDYLYMVQWAKQIGVSDLLSRAVKEMEADRAGGSA